MLSNHLGVNIFLQGVSDYLEAHAYGPSTLCLSSAYTLLTAQEMPLQTTYGQRSAKPLEKTSLVSWSAVPAVVAVKHPSSPGLGPLDQENRVPSSYSC